MSHVVTSFVTVLLCWEDRDLRDTDGALLRSRAEHFRRLAVVSGGRLLRPVDPSSRGWLRV
ncbi:hypothetical protein N7457_003204 [Penicillium paradoxum]|uniref:uncharacterized protein n=1 Tax=Penicillium paradoxum TaxID=176176 RepID=UPI00254754EE|nr:uncharacterized protein N7457_003204 [Penicillium paradoxum]KAJ5788214.1 hypothetical protein N7457_003204 [Penicillium paradoxum]